MNLKKGTASASQETCSIVGVLQYDIFTTFFSCDPLRDQAGAVFGTTYQNYCFQKLLKNIYSTDEWNYQMEIKISKNNYFSNPCKILNIFILIYS